MTLFMGQSACLAQTAPPEPEKPPIETAQSLLNQLAPGAFTVMALVESRRKPRPWKYLKVVPGKEYRWWYRCLDENGVTVTREFIAPLKGINDDRSLRESHPNIWAVTSVGSAAVPTLCGVLVGGVFSR
jgi:hypothetical protein